MAHQFIFRRITKMLQVNEEKMLKDYADLVKKQEENLAKIEVDAKAYAATHGYDEDKTARFVEFTQGIEGNGLSDEENKKLEILGSYIDEVEDPVEAPVEGEDSAEVSTSAGATINVL